MTRPTVVIQTSGSQEGRSMLSYCMTRDIRIVRCATGGIRAHAETLAQGALPVGSVEFLRAAMHPARIKEPAPLGYPDSMRPWLHREVHCIPRYDIPSDRDCFLKPAGGVKLFDGFVQSAVPAESPVEEQYRQEQRRQLNKLPGSTPIYISPIVSFQSEWRYYVLNGAVVGKARYDDGDENATAPDENITHAMMQAFIESQQAPVAFSLDVGVLSTGETALVEINDAWALGLYRDMNDLDAYFRMLTERWTELRAGKAYK